MTIPFGIMALIMKKRFISPIIPTKKVGFSKYCAWIAIGMGGCIGANIATNYVIMLFEAGGYELSQSEMLDPDSTFACITALISTAIIPAICEEFALRCCSLGILKKHGKGFAVFATSIVFGLMHGNVIQFVFAFLVGLILAYVTVRLDNVVPAMFIHGFNNGLSVLQDTLKYYFNEDVATTALSIVWVFWIICAIVAIVVLAVKKDLLPEKGAKAQKNPASLSFGSKLLCLLPGLSVPLLILIVASATTIVKSVA
jgi:hypothetical protein